MNPFRDLLDDRVRGPYKDACGYKVYFYPRAGGRPHWVRLSAARSEAEARHDLRRIEDEIKSNPRLRDGLIPHTLGTWHEKFKALHPTLARCTVGSFEHAVKRLAAARET